MIFFSIKQSSAAYNSVFKAANTPQSPTQVVLHIHSTLIAGSIVNVFNGLIYLQ